MKKVLFINHPEYRCGVYQFGNRVFRLARLSTRVEYYYADCSSSLEFQKAFSDVKPEYLVLNFHPATTMNGWLTEDLLKSVSAKKYYLWHGFDRPSYDKMLFFGCFGRGSQAPLEKSVILPRPLIPYKGEHPKNSIVTIGSFGFAMGCKGFHFLVEMVNKQFSEAVINIHMPNAYFGDRNGDAMRTISEWCRSENKNPGIKLNITHDFKTEEELVTFLAGNDINCGLYSCISQGISSSMDYYLSSGRPVGVTDNMMFSHVLERVGNSIVLSDTNTIQDILNKGTIPLEPIYKEWSTENFVKQFEELFL